MAVDLLVNRMVDQMALWATGNVSAALDLYLHLYVNNYTLVVTSTITNLTECAAPGYAADHLTPASWTGSTVAGQAAYQYPQITFHLTGPGSPAETIYGHYFTDGASGPLLWGQTWSTPFAIPAGGADVLITPFWVDKQCP